MFTSTSRTILVAATIASTLSTTLAIPLAPLDAYEFEARGEAETGLQARGAWTNAALGAVSGLAIGHFFKKNSQQAAPQQAAPQDPSAPGRRSLDEDNESFAREEQAELQSRGAWTNAALGAVSGLAIGHFFKKSSQQPAPQQPAPQDPSAPGRRSLDEDNESFAREVEADWMLAARELDEQFTRNFEEDFLAARDYEGIDYYYM